MISSTDIAAYQRSKCSLDIFFMLGILLRNSSTLKEGLEPFQPSNSRLMLAQSLAPFPCLFSVCWYYCFLIAKRPIVAGELRGIWVLPSPYILKSIIHDEF